MRQHREDGEEENVQTKEENLESSLSFTFLRRGIVQVLCTANFLSKVNVFTCLLPLPCARTKYVRHFSWQGPSLSHLSHQVKLDVIELIAMFANSAHG